MTASNSRRNCNNDRNCKLQEQPQKRPPQLQQQTATTTAKTTDASTRNNSKLNKCF